MPSFEKNTASGLWSVRFREILPDGVHQKRLSGFKTKKEAQWGYEDYISNKDAEVDNRSESEKAGDMLFDDLLSEYLKFKEKRTKSTSYIDTKGKIANGITPYFTGKRMADITPKVIYDWIENINYSYATKKWLFNMLGSIYKYGGRYYDLPNTIDKVDRPVNTEAKKEMEVWTPEDFARFIEAVTNPSYKILFETLYGAGCRKGEALALTWADISAEHISITKSLSRKVEGAPYIITSTKTKETRKVRISPSLAAKLQKHKETQDAPHDTDFVFGGKNPLPCSSVDRYFLGGIKASGVKKIRIHDLRHSYASFLISKGVSIVAVSRQLGHSSIEETLKTYSHMMPDDDTKILAALEQFEVPDTQ